MGLMRFQVHPPGRQSPEALERAYLAGLDGVPWQNTVETTPEGFNLRRAVNDSGYLHMPWNVAGRGEQMLTTGTLLERSQPYLLQAELARGKVNQVRNQLAAWQSIGLNVPDALPDKLQEAVRALVQAVTGHNQAEAAGHAEEAIALACQAADMLGATYTQQALAARHRQAAKFDTRFGVNIGHSLLDSTSTEALLRSFNTATVPLSWTQTETGEGQYNWSICDRQIEWCRSQRLKVMAGPILQLDKFGLPDWMYLWEDDFENVSGFAEQHVRTVALRYRGNVDYWICAGRVHSDHSLALSEEEKLRLVVRSFEIVHEITPGIPLLVRFDQPWGEYLNRSKFDLSPLHIADALARSGLGLSGIELEINVGYFPGGTSPRDLLDFNRLIDHWSLLGLPLYFALTCPSSVVPDVQAHSDARPLEDAVPGGWNPQAQAAWIEKIVPLLLAKPTVRGVTWNQFRDTDPHQFPNSGLIDAVNKVKPALNVLAGQRMAHVL